jgi:hypothetical protein
MFDRGFAVVVAVSGNRLDSTRSIESSRNTIPALHVSDAQRLIL